ncbi:MAG: peptidase S10 [Chloroflexi bacterium]|nr:MAG: peptidase S10 [Chloroflexota bacterium]MBL1195576.1 peptidase S10 [Chloroflexota bacterium]NOH12861.1 peptidase S10 [Chloroflexota bacterium]
MVQDQNKSTNDVIDENEKPAPEEQLVQTHHSITIDGKEIKYTATAGTIILKEEDDQKAETKAKASVFYVAYTLDGVKDISSRPITFSFNGGPGSSSVWLHLGVLGPRRVKMLEDGQAPPPPYELVDNEFSLLDSTDLVFIDPVSTGFSRSVPGEEAKQFHGFQKDIEYISEFIRVFTTRQKRWTSPKFLIGESYGTTRAAGLAGYLQARHGFYLNGIMLISSILNFGTARFDVGNDLPYVLFLPTYTATAWYHKQLNDDLQSDLRSTLDEVEAFANNEYVLALMQGDDLPSKERDEIVKKLTRYTGLSPDYIERSNLRIDIMRFTKELRREDRLTVGRLDTRFTAVDKDAAGETFEFDPSYAVIQGPFTATLNDYLRAELEYENDLPYEILTSRVQPWDYTSHQNQYLNVGETLRQAISYNPALKVFVANGYYDLATPYFATEYTFKHLQFEEHLRDNVSMEYYEAGHMMYIHQESMAQLKTHLKDFLQNSIQSA